MPNPGEHPRWVVILGAGLAGLTVASELEKYLTAHPDAMHVVLVDHRHSLLFSTANQFALTRRAQPQQVTNPYTDLKFTNVFFIQDEVISINTDRRLVYSRGHRFRYDVLVVAMEAEFDFEKVANLNKAAYNISSMESVLQLRDALADFGGGNILVTAGTALRSNPTACYEYALLLKTLVKTRMEEKVNEITKVILAVPEEPSYSAWQLSAFEDIIRDRDIQFLPGHKPMFVDYTRRGVIFSNGEKVKYDILVADLPTRPAQALIESKLATEKQGIPSHPFTCRTDLPNVYCIGDCAEMFLPPPESLDVPKAGPFFVSQGKAVAQDILQLLATNPPPPWRPDEGLGQREAVAVYAEVGSSEAIEIVANIFNNAKDIFEFSDPGKDNMKRLIGWWDDLVTEWFLVKDAP
uniref:Predicted protein n=1 Tax=Hordeum vulgare subsp. vulgare TaxID=112509 RepID=F2DFX5_HORVV|nr:predicted protein [Hordeum vulgare subsp. vulgare]